MLAFRKDVKSRPDTVVMNLPPYFCYVPSISSKSLSSQPLRPPLQFNPFRLINYIQDAPASSSHLDYIPRDAEYYINSARLRDEFAQAISTSVTIKSDLSAERFFERTMYLAAFYSAYRLGVAFPFDRGFKKNPVEWIALQLYAGNTEFCEESLVILKKLYPPLCRCVKPEGYFQHMSLDYKFTLQFNMGLLIIAYTKSRGLSEYRENFSDAIDYFLSIPPVSRFSSIACWNALVLREYCLPQPLTQIPSSAEEQSPTDLEQLLRLARTSQLLLKKGYYRKGLESLKNALAYCTFSPDEISAFTSQNPIIIQSSSAYKFILAMNLSAQFISALLMQAIIASKMPTLDESKDPIDKITNIIAIYLLTTKFIDDARLTKLCEWIIFAFQCILPEPFKEKLKASIIIDADSFLDQVEDFFTKQTAKIFEKVKDEASALSAYNKIALTDKAQSDFQFIIAWLLQDIFNDLRQDRQSCFMMSIDTEDNPDISSTHILRILCNALINPGSLFNKKHKIIEQDYPIDEQKIELSLDTLQTTITPLVLKELIPYFLMKKSLLLAPDASSSMHL